MVAIGSGDDHRIEIGIGEHRIVIVEALGRLVSITHALNQIAGDIANCMQIGVAGLHGRFEMRGLGNRAAAENAHPEAAVLFLDHAVYPADDVIDRRTGPASRPKAPRCRR